MVLSKLINVRVVVVVVVVVVSCRVVVRFQAQEDEKQQQASRREFSVLMDRKPTTTNTEDHPRRPSGTFEVVRGWSGDGDVKRDHTFETETETDTRGPIY